MVAEELKKQTLSELQKLAKDKGIKSCSKYKKSELVEELLNAENAASEKEASTEVLQETEEAGGVLEVLPDGFGFLRGPNYISTPKDVYVSNAQIKRFNLKTGDKVIGNTRETREGERFKPLIFVKTVNGDIPYVAVHRKPFEHLTPIYPEDRIKLSSDNSLAMRLVDLFSPLGKGQRGLIVAPPMAGKTTLVKDIANAVTKNNPETELIVLLIDERPEEVSDMQKSINGDIVFSTFDQLPQHHVKVAEIVLERAKRIAEHGRDVVILLDSLTRLTRAYNLASESTGRTLSGGIDPGAFHGPKKFFGAARNIENGGSITILATALVETGSRMDEVIFEEFKGTGNMEIHLNRKLQERRIFPAIDIYKSGTRRDELLLSKEEKLAVDKIRRKLYSEQTEDTTEKIINMICRTKNNQEFVSAINK